MCNATPCQRTIGKYLVVTQGLFDLASILSPTPIHVDTIIKRVFGSIALNPRVQICWHSVGLKVFHLFGGDGDTGKVQFRPVIHLADQAMTSLT